MKKNQKKILMINNIVCVVLMIALLGTLLLPSWDFIAHIKTKDFACRECGYTLRADKLEDEFACPNVLDNGEECGAPKGKFKATTIKEDVPSNSSVLEYTWFAYNNKDLTKIFEEQGQNINDIVLAPFLLTLLSAFGIVFCLLNIKGCWQSLFPAVGSVMMLISLLTIPIFKQGPYWIFCVIVNAALVVASLALLAQFVTKIVKWCVVPVKQ